MALRMFARLTVTVLVLAVAGLAAAPAGAAWRLNSTSTTSIAYNQGLAFDNNSLGPTARSFFFDGASSTANSGLYRTSSTLSQNGSNGAVIPSTSEGYNHLGDLSFDPVNVSDPGTPRVLLPLECYYPNKNPSNTCGTGAIGVADPATLRFLYYVNLDRVQIQKAMWADVSPRGNWIWTSNGKNLLAYRAEDVNQTTAKNQRNGVAAGIAGEEYAYILPTTSVTGGAFYQDDPADPDHAQLLLSLNLGSSFEVVSYSITMPSDGSRPTIAAGGPAVVATVTKSWSYNEPEGLAVTSALNGTYPLGGLLHWQMLPSIKLYSRILNFMPG